MLNIDDDTYVMLNKSLTKKSKVVKIMYNYLLKNIEMLKYVPNLLHTASLEICNKISPHEKKIIIMVGLFS